MRKLIKKFLSGGSNYTGWQQSLNYSSDYSGGTNHQLWEQLQPILYQLMLLMQYDQNVFDDQERAKTNPGVGFKSMQTVDYNEFLKLLNQKIAEQQLIKSDLEQASRQKRYNRFKNIMGGVGGMFAQTYDIIPTRDKQINNTDSLVADLRGKTALMMMQSGNPWLMAAGATVGVLDKTGAFGDASEGLGEGNDFGNAVASFLLPGVGWGAFDWLGAKKTDNYKMSDALGSSSGYGDSRNYAEKALKNSGAHLLFGGDLANERIRNARRQDEKIQGILGEAKNDFAIQNNMSEINGLRILNVTSGGNQMFRAAKHGMKMSPTKEQIEKAKLIIAKQGLIIDFNDPPKENKKVEENKELDVFLSDLMNRGFDMENYDYVKFWGDQEAREKYNKDTNPNKHFPDTYKKPGHMTFSKESIYNTPKTPGGTWYKDTNEKWHFTPSDWQKQLHTYEEYKKYFDEQEPDAVLDWDDQSQTLKFQNGGQMNVIPDGALHARLHHMEDVNPDLKGQITKKGIPVVSEGEGGEIELQAEIERNELILSKDVTTAIEELWKKYKEEKKDEYAIMAGLILAQLIIENTDDRTGLIQLVE